MSSIDEETPSMKGKNQLEKRFNTIRQRSNSFWKQTSNVYSRFLWNYFQLILPICFILTIGLTSFGFVFGRFRTFDENDFLLRSSESVVNARRLREIFGDDSTLRVHQQLELYPSLDVIIKRKDSSNMLDEKIFNEVSALNALIQSIVVENAENSSTWNYSSLCVRHNQACMIDGNYLLSETFRQALSNLSPPANGYYVDNHGANGIVPFIFGKNYKIINATLTDADYEDDEEISNVSQLTTTTNVVQIISHVPLFRLRYSLKSSTFESKQLALKWERKAMEFLTEHYQSSLIELAVSTSNSINETVTKKAHAEGIFLALTFVLFLVFVHFLSSIEGNRLTSVGFLPIFGLISIVLSTGTTFGFLTLFQVEIVEPMALIVFAVAIFESMRISIVCGEYHRLINEQIEKLSTTLPIEEIFSSIVESTHPIFFITTLSLGMIYFLLATFTSMISSILICLTLILHIFIVYLVHSTFFSSCLIITLRRIGSRRHCLSCHRLSSDEENSSLSSTKTRSICRLNSLMKRCFCLLSIVAFLFSVWFALSIDTRLFDENFLPTDAPSLRSYMKSQIDDFNIGPMVMFTIPEPIDYEDSNVRQAMNALLEQCQNENRINDFRLFWIEKENLPTILHEKLPLEMRITPFSHNDLIVKEEKNKTTIVASRFYCQYKSLQGDRDDIRTMNNIYTYAKQSSLPSVFPYSLIFPKYESLAQIRLDMYVLVLLFIVVPLIFTFMSFVWLKMSLSVVFHLLLLFTSTLAILYQFHRLSFNFVNAIWLMILPMIFTETLIHSAFFHRNSQWKYNRVFLSLIISFIVLYICPIESYVFLTIRNSLMYQSMICLILINFIIPSFHYFLFELSNVETVAKTIQMTTTIIPESEQSLTNEIVDRSKMKSSI